MRKRPNDPSSKRAFVIHIQESLLYVFVFITFAVLKINSSRYRVLSALLYTFFYIIRNLHQQLPVALLIDLVFLYNSLAHSPTVAIHLNTCNKNFTDRSAERGHDVNKKI